MSDTDDLNRQLEAAYTAIQELDEDLAAGRLSAADHAELRARSERHAASLVKRLPDAGAAVGSRRSGSATAGRPTLAVRIRSPIGLMFGAVGLLVFGLVLGMLVARFTAEERPAAAVASPVTTPRAGMPGTAPPGPQTVSATLDALRQKVEREDATIKDLLAFAHLALDEGHVPASIWAYKRVLAREPKNVEAITHVGVILAQGNHLDEALKRLDEAVKLDPRYAHAHWDRAQILFNGKRDYRGAAAAIEAFLELTPTGEDADRARQMLAEARKLASEAPSAGAGPAGTASGSKTKESSAVRR